SPTHCRPSRRSGCRLSRKPRVGWTSRRRADVARALIAVDRDIRVVDRAHDVAHAVADVLVTVARGLRGRGRAGGGVRNTAREHAARACPALGVGAWTLRSGQALNAGARSVADRAAVLVASLEVAWACQQVALDLRV